MDVVIEANKKSLYNSLKDIYRSLDEESRKNYLLSMLSKFKLNEDRDMVISVSKQVEEELKEESAEHALTGE